MPKKRLLRCIWKLHSACTGLKEAIVSEVACCAPIVSVGGLALSGNVTGIYVASMQP